MENICEPNNCCGCRACENICPQNAITMLPNDKGFLYPHIDNEKCINCGLCQKTCPIFNKTVQQNPIKIFACKNKSETIRKNSSSGGTFQALSELFFQNEGFVYGAGFNQNNIVTHLKATNLNELNTIRGSKYVQSNMNTIFNDILNNLKDNKNILFSGTPCQVDALKQYTKSHDNLLLVDILCYGVPSPEIFENYKALLEKKYNSKITTINFRHKENDFLQNIKITFENGETYISNSNNGDYFYKMFNDKLSLRKSCFSCKYKDFNRVGDISLGDFWGYQNGPAKDFGDTKGVSLVLINTPKGLDFFNKIKDKIEYLEIQKEDCYPYNCFSNFPIPLLYDEFWNTYINNGLEYTIKKYYNI